MAEEDESSPEGAHEPIDEEDDDADGTMREIMETPTSRRSRTRTRSPVAERYSSAKASGSAAKASGVGGTTNDSSVGAKAKTSATGAETTTSAPAVLPKTMGAAPCMPAGPPPPTPHNPPGMGGGGRPPLGAGGPPPPTPAKGACGVLQQGIYTVVWDPNTNVTWMSLDAFPKGSVPHQVMVPPPTPPTQGGPSRPGDASTPAAWD
ncbi:unnamed protein product [Symbiodinium natans]|uniref:Uncharacterized protein n=1 Tax=Symbiodinium natans TaxID=878477 RepID=A0A812SAR4_9DINO|nr:unnamed protein product [Symbiodinium natans]